MVEPAGAMAEEDKMLRNCLEHVSCTRVYCLLVDCFVRLTFAFVQALALSKSRIASKFTEAVERSRVTRLVEMNTRLLAELAKSRSRVAELEGPENVLKVSYNDLREDYKNLDANKKHEEKFLKFRQHFRMRLNSLHLDLEKSMGELGG
jgi:hypothetical protein